MISPKNHASKVPHASRTHGFTMLEVCVTVTLSILLAAAVTGSLVQCMRFAAAARLLTNARAIVHRNLNAASGVAFFSTTGAPTILQLTSGAVCDDDGVATGGTPVENIELGSNGGVIVSGTLNRVVTQQPVCETSATTAVVYRVIFTLNYSFANRSYSYSESTLRAQDSN